MTSDPRCQETAVCRAWKVNQVVTRRRVRMTSVGRWDGGVGGCVYRAVSHEGRSPPGETTGGNEKIIDPSVRARRDIPSHSVNKGRRHSQTGRGGRRQEHQRSGRNTCVFHLLVFCSCRTKTRSSLVTSKHLQPEESHFTQSIHPTATKASIRSGIL